MASPDSFAASRGKIAFGAELPEFTQQSDRVDKVSTAGVAIEPTR